ncbi:MAG: hypothetical protein WDM76_02445 [Limisphaerales bacterium]
MLSKRLFPEADDAPDKVYCKYAVLALSNPIAVVKSAVVTAKVVLLVAVFYTNKWCIRESISAPRPCSRIIACACSTRRKGNNQNYHNQTLLKEKNH